MKINVETLRQKIDAMNMSQTAFAEYCGVGLSTLHNHMKGQTGVTLPTLKCYALALSCDWTELLEEPTAPRNIVQDDQLAFSPSILPTPVEKLLEEDGPTWIACCALMDKFDPAVIVEYLSRRMND